MATTSTTADENRSYSRGKVKKVMFNDRCGYALIYYDPISDYDSKIDALGLKNLPYTIPLNTKALKTLKPAGKPGTLKDYEVRRVNIPGKYEAAKEFMERKLIENKIMEIRECCYNVKRYYQKAEKFDLKRREVISPRFRNKLRGKSSDEICDFLVEDVMKNVDYVYDRNVEPKKIKKRAAVGGDCKKCNKAEPKNCEDKAKHEKSADKVAAKVPKPIQKIQVKTPCLGTLDEEEKDNGKCQICCSCQSQQQKPMQQQQLTVQQTKSRSRSKSPSPSPSVASDAPLTEKEMRKSLEETLRKREAQNYEQLSVDTLRRRRNDLRNQRKFDELLFEINYGRVLRKLKSEIRRLREDYS